MPPQLGPRMSIGDTEPQVMTMSAP